MTATSSWDPSSGLWCRARRPSSLSCASRDLFPSRVHALPEPFAVGNRPLPDVRATDLDQDVDRFLGVFDRAKPRRARHRVAAVLDDDVADLRESAVEKEAVWPEVALGLDGKALVVDHETVSSSRMTIQPCLI